jgi:hypothetical protein
MRIKSFHQDQTEDDHENSGEQASPKENPVDFAALCPTAWPQAQQDHQYPQNPPTRPANRKPPQAKPRLRVACRVPMETSRSRTAPARRINSMVTPRSSANTLGTKSKSPARLLVRRPVRVRQVRANGMSQGASQQTFTVEKVKHISESCENMSK